MSDTLSRYKKLDYQLPKENLAWQMREAGVENFGNDGVDTLPLLKPGADEILLRVDAIGICFSDVKLITQGSSHPRITGRDLVKEPVIGGHEVSLTVVEAGDNHKDKYKPGDRFMVQADIYYKGVSVAFGYVLPGGMQQFVMVGNEVLNGDEGSYLISVKPETGYAEAALVEPWTCVVASYRIKPRKTLEPGGVMLIAQVEGGNWELGEGLCADGKPGKIILAGVGEGLKSQICGCGCCSTEVIEIGKLQPEHVKALSQERTGDKGFNDVVVLGTPSPELAEALSACLGHEAVMAVLADKSIARPLQIDVGRVHYDYIDYIGAKSNKVSDAYSKSRDSNLVPGGTAWFIGAAGPMGQMHVQRAAKLKDGPKKILCTDVDNARLNYLKAGVADSAKENGVEIVFLNPMEAGLDAQNKAIDQMTGGKGFDDIVVLAPVAALITGAVPHLADGGLMNIFAGVPRGTIATIDLSVINMKGARFVGSSGSRPQDMIDTLAYTEAGELPTRDSMAAVGGIDAMADGVKAVKAAKFPGKTVIFPHIELPLTALTDLDKVLPNVYAKLKDGTFWTPEAEEELLKSKLEII
ncbi:MAG: alcohol dehydrogenase catalytic domain-containing protein [Armatimonadota bacterium]|nr:zinc-binding dehydrogenase [bacterium]